MPKTLTTKEVARLCLVSDATVKRWEDAGVLKSERTSGGHRRFRPEEVARFQREQGLGEKQFHGDESVLSVGTRRRGTETNSESELFRSLVAGREEEVAGMLIGAYLEGNSLANVFDDHICPAMRRIGQLWADGDISVAQEHLATRAVTCSLYKLRNVMPVAEFNGNTAICCAIEGDFHELPTHLVQMILEDDGWEVINFGANLPLYSLCQEISQHSPKLICISSTMMTDIERLSRDYVEFNTEICRLNSAVILGGRAFREQKIRERFSADFYAENFSQVIEFSRELVNAEK